MSAQAIMTAKKPKTKGHDPMALRILSAARSPRLRSLCLRTPGCRSQLFRHLVLFATPYGDTCVAREVFNQKFGSY